METKMIANEMFQVAEIELIYKSRVNPSERPVVTTSKDAYQILLASWNDCKIELVEEFKILLLNRSNKVMAMYQMSSGGISGTVADTRLAFTAALKANAVNIILAHNHPSGSLKPSRQDEVLTQKFKAAGEMLDIKILDHLIVCRESYYSFADEGLI